MAVRNLRYDTDPLLHKVSKKVEKVDDKIRQLIIDMFETMYANGGIGLAAPQVGILKRIIVIDTGEQNESVALINPEILSMKEDVVVKEGCLSFPNLFAKVKRKKKCKVKALDINGEEIVLEAEGLFAQAIQHEINHLDGIVFTDLAIDGSYFSYGNNNKEITNIVYDEKLHKVMIYK